MFVPEVAPNAETPVAALGVMQPWSWVLVELLQVALVVVAAAYVE